MEAAGKILEVDARDVRKVVSEKKKMPLVSSFFEARHLNDTLDVRGMDALESCDVLEKYLEEALVMGLSTVTVIHGKGRGVLRKAVSEYLKDHHHVSNHRIGEWNEGADGVTIVQLKKNDK